MTDAAPMSRDPVFLTALESLAEASPEMAPEARTAAALAIARRTAQQRVGLDDLVRSARQDPDGFVAVPARLLLKLAGATADPA